MSDVMLHGVLCMPPELWHDSEVDKMQRYSRYLEASRRIEDQEKEIDRLRAELDNAESALIRHGFRKSCGIAACNCGDQWSHGGLANERLREIDEALPYENGKTILQRVTGVVAEAERCSQWAEIAGRHGAEVDRLRAECGGLRAKNERLIRILSDMHLITCPPLAKANGGAYAFRPAEAGEYWQELSDRIRAIPAAIDAAMRPSGETK